jgi:hypothetical protein
MVQLLSEPKLQFNRSHLDLIETTLTPESQQPPALITPTDILKSVQAQHALTTDEKKILLLFQRLGANNNALCRQLLSTNHFSFPWKIKSLRRKLFNQQMMH